ncbi:hypothetical protein [Gilliamella sp. Choc6-1]|nr:hypothetical protein [Gilliamella apicola]KFA58200.1 hypothetical protein GAPWKB11_1697 [Gilliamella apicola]
MSEYQNVILLIDIFELKKSANHRFVVSASFLFLLGLFHEN